jgi:hypothetical protein
MSDAVVVPQCTHVKVNGEVCGSPAVSGTAFCYHHSAVKTALAKARNGKAPEEGFAPIPFVFPEDRASMQINFFLLLQAFNEQRIDERTYRLMLSMLKAMAKNLGRTGSLVEASGEAVSDVAVSGGAVSDVAVSGGAVSGASVSDVSDGERGTANEAPFEFSAELMAKMEEIERLSPNDPSRAARICAAVAEGANELHAQGLGLLDMSSIVGLPAR